jgi:hypothetical protein
VRSIRSFDRRRRHVARRSPPALPHFTARGAIKVVEAPGDAGGLPVAWMAASAVLPWLAFIPSPRR